MKNLILALAVLAAVPAQAVKHNVANCKAVSVGTGAATTVEVQYDLEGKVYQITVFEKWIGGSRTTTENAVRRATPMIVGSPTAYESKSFILRANFTVSPSAKSNGSLIFKDRGDQRLQMKCGA